MLVYWEQHAGSLLGAPVKGLQTHRFHLHAASSPKPQGSWQGTMAPFPVSDMVQALKRGAHP
jgi:hypothetical protein